MNYLRYLKIENEMHYLSVIDSGVGMTKEQADNIFSNDTINWKEGTSGERGTGLGLILCKDLVEELNGSIAVISEQGQGSNFFLLKLCLLHNKIKF